jgi:putative membrane protein
VQWWCSATGQPWTWEWKAYPGVWLFVACLALSYVYASRRAATAQPSGASQRDPIVRDSLRAEPPSRKQQAWFLAGVVSIWLALDWPIGALGAGYLASFHTITYVLLVMVAPPCLILAVPTSWIREALSRPILNRVLQDGGRPWVGLAGFNTILLVTHIPAVVDTLMVTQTGALLIDLSWLVGGALLWWPVMGPSEVVRMGRPMKMAYLFASTLIPIIPSAFLTFAEFPFYRTYELAPRIFDPLTAQQDQQVAGLLMKVIGDLPVWFGFGVIFFRWAKEGEQHPPPVHPDALRHAGLNG